MNKEMRVLANQILKRLGKCIGFVTNPNSKGRIIRVNGFAPATIEISKHCRDVLDEYIRDMEAKNAEEGSS